MQCVRRKSIQPLHRMIPYPIKARCWRWILHCDVDVLLGRRLILRRILPRFIVPRSTILPPHASTSRLHITTATAGAADIQCCVSACSTPSGSGNCEVVTSCTGTPVAGFCPGDADVQCCLGSSASCTTPEGSGTCEATGACSASGGTSYPGSIQCHDLLYPCLITFLHFTASHPFPGRARLLPRGRRFPVLRDGVAECEQVVRRGRLPARFRLGRVLLPLQRRLLHHRPRRDVHRQRRHQRLHHSEQRVRPPQTSHYSFKRNETYCPSKVPFYFLTVIYMFIYDRAAAGIPARYVYIFPCPTCSTSAATQVPALPALSALSALLVKQLHRHRHPIVSPH